MNLVYKYGAHPPTVNATLIDSQIRVAHDYYNELIKIEQNFHRKTHELQESLSPFGTKYEKAAQAYKDACEAYSVYESTLKGANARERRRVATPEQKAKLKELRAHRKAAKTRMGEIKKEKRSYESTPEYQQYLSQMDELYQTKTAHIRQTRGEAVSFGLHWGTYLQVEDAVQAALKAAYKGNILSCRQCKENDTYCWHRPVPKRYYKGSGVLAAQVMKGMAVPLWESQGHGQTQIDVKNGVVRLRLGSEGRNPIWGEWPVVFHRPLPPEARVKWVKMKREVLSSGKHEWSCLITLELPDDYVCEEGGNGVVAIDLGWRLQKSSSNLRVGYCYDGNGQVEGGSVITEHRNGMSIPETIQIPEGGYEIQLPQAIIERLRKVDDLQSIRRRIFNEAVDRLKTWRKECRDECPEWFLTRTRTLAHWASESALSSLVGTPTGKGNPDVDPPGVVTWRHNRFDGDESIFEDMEAWRKQDKHLLTWQESQRRSVLRRRKDFYRRIGASLARRYSSVVFEDFDLAKMKRRNPVDGDVDVKAVKWNEKTVASGEFREAVAQAFMLRGGKVWKVPSKLTTITCHQCGCQEKWDAAPSIEHVCSQCGAKWDQDANAAVNILHIYENGDTVPFYKKRAPKVRKRPKGEKKAV